MKAIKAGETGEDKVKKYEPFNSEVTSENGKLDVAALANSLAPAGSGLNKAPAPIKTIKQEATGRVFHLLQMCASLTLAHRRT